MAHTPTTSTAVTPGLRQIILRKPATHRPEPIPPEYLFLEHPGPQERYKVHFRHPGYPDRHNILLGLWAWDHEDGGIHYGLAHNACAIIANNRFDGYFSLSSNANAARITVAWDDVLPANTDYYFHVPGPLGEGGGGNDDDDDDDVVNYNAGVYVWPAVSCFQDWEFPRSLPEVWKRWADTGPIPRNTAPQSQFPSAVLTRDIVCQATGFSSATEVAHLVPEREQEWFTRNAMSRYNGDTTLDSRHLIRDIGNAMLLRCDIHKQFDDRIFVFFPKAKDCVVLHMLAPTPDIGLLYHNTGLPKLKCTPEFLFARFAWAIFPGLATFSFSNKPERFVGRASPITRQFSDGSMNSSADAQRQAAASRSNSPKRRARSPSINQDVEEVAHCSKSPLGLQTFSAPFEASKSLAHRQHQQHPHTKRRRMSKTSYTPSDPQNLKSCRSSPSRSQRPDPSSRDISSHLKTPPVHTSSNLNSDYLEVMRERALALQRPPSFVPGMAPYDPRRPAKEELEIMGIEIRDDLSEGSDYC